MLLDLREMDDHAHLESQVCIVGAGAAGISLARRLASQSVDVLLLESGGADHEDAVQDLAKGETQGHDYWELREARLRFFGGTTAIWGGRCAEFDPNDFDRRPWLAHSGWPISKSDLDPFYADARAAMGLPPRQCADEIWASLGETPPQFEPGGLVSDFWQFTPSSEQFTLRRCGDLVESDKVRILLHATLTSIERSHDGRSIETIGIGDVSGRRATVSARHFVLAAGGIENARLLLACDIGNEHDQAGRYFMEHPHARGGEIVSGKLWKILRQFGRHLRDPEGHKHAALIRPSAEMQEREGILGSAFTLGACQREQAREIATMRAYNKMRHDLSPSARNRALWLTAKKIVLRGHEVFDPLRSKLLVMSGWSATPVIRAEQAPNPDSRITLGESTDALGMREARLDWRFSDIDKRTVRVMMKRFARELERLGIGRFELDPWIERSDEIWHSDPLVCSHYKGGYHHMGTTRMSASPRDGVVDAECRVHGVENLHVAGSSLFTTSGWANPTLGIVALAYRSADYIAREISRPQAQARLRKAS
ncbi:FAD-dependent oxidoreductase [Sphingomicrobium clamense]|uniref:GMC family oxidoreductase n=1 Tax=Sphingomicrobium clamense TaxID=2851013 RepID=A0ABS6V3A1_9SPHN|nr:GMC family oxidoreductase [Sphingomicrobium sp. B8]MBW0144028.1 GMC family oxidoreductase [Sphingomicrobium sp. B8]